jgi:chromosome segregation ATPase
MVLAEHSQGRTALERAMAPVFAKSAELDAIEAEIETRNEEIAAITEDQTRVRNNMSVLKGSAAERHLLERYTKQLNAQETRIEDLKRDLAELRNRQARAERELGELIAAVSIDVTF